jgi:SSS family transporter
MQNPVPRLTSPIGRGRKEFRLLAIIFFMAALRIVAPADEPVAHSLQWSELPSLPNEVGVAGPFAGIHNDALIVAGGANFSPPVWDNDKQWHDAIHILVRDGENYIWQDGGRLPKPIGYGAAVSSSAGVICMGGNDAEEIFDDVFSLQVDPETGAVTQTELPSLPSPCAYGSATVIGDVVYLIGGQSGLTLDTAMNNVWSLDLSQASDSEAFRWIEHDPMVAPSRAFNITVAQHDGYHQSIFVISGRRQQGDDPEFLKDVWQFTPATGQWRQRADAPRSVMAGTGASFGQSHLFVLGGADGSLWGKVDELRDDHPGFPKQALAYHTITDTWTSAGAMPVNHVTTVAVKWGDSIILPSGEVRPRVRSPKIWQVTPTPGSHEFGLINYVVLIGYLASMVGIGVYFTKQNKSTDDFFRGGKSIPWWAAGCSIFATMLSSLTFTGLPSKAFAQDWTYFLGNMMIPLVAIVAVFVALPFYRRLDVTSAYEYLEKRFNRGVRLFGSASFTVFHIFRMAVVLSLTGLALAVATPLTPTQSVLVMGVLSILYCTLGGIEAVIWTDTAQTVVLFGGALVALAMLIMGIDGGFSGMLDSAGKADKLRMVNLHWDATSSQIALWIIIVGGIGQNLSSYTADQAVVQRYMTTETQSLAARSIWTNAFLTIPASLLFFGLGTALFAYYQSHPEKLDPSVTSDQIFPLFIAREMPVGLAGLIVAGVFAAAQSTVSTSMNSSATAVVTDFMKPLNLCKSDAGYLRAARVLTVLIGVLGTAAGLWFIDPEIKSLFDAFLKVIGMFMGVLGGLFVLGVMTTRASGSGALIGALVGAAVMFSMWLYTPINGYIYTATGVASCFVVGYLASMLLPGSAKDLTGLTIYTTKNSEF